MAKKVNKSLEELERQVAEKTARTSEAKNAAAAFSLTPSANHLPVVVPGLKSYTPEDLAQRLPGGFDADKFAIADALTPPDTLPQASIEQHQRGMKIYEGASRALDLYGAAFDVTKKVFVTIGKQAEAVGAGVAAATKIKNTEGVFVDYLTAAEQVQQKVAKFNIERSRTETATKAATFSMQEISEQLEQAQSKARLAQSKTQELQGRLQEFQALVGAIDVKSEEV